MHIKGWLPYLHPQGGERLRANKLLTEKLVTEGMRMRGAGEPLPRHLNRKELPDLLSAVFRPSIDTRYPGSRPLGCMWCAMYIQGGP
jgi:hypothetical protein